jgi:hypothetical protein
MEREPYDGTDCRAFDEKNQALTTQQLAEVEHFVEALQAWPSETLLTRHATALSEPAFTAGWNNPEDEAYDAL